jgi:excinuclease ABC subunit C
MNEWKFQRFKRDEYLRVPGAPGVYKYLNKQGVIIYVGKAKNLKKRVSSYFISQGQHTLKTAHLVSEISEIEFVIVNNEYEALVVESSLIKENQPKYNILLKDGKSYPYIIVTKERFPRVLTTRKVIPSDGDYFGPFTSGRAMHNVLNLIKKLYQLRTCNLALSAKNIDAQKFKVCLEYHIGNCKGPCEALQTEQNYLEQITEIKEILRGNLGPVKNSFKGSMEVAIESMRYEDAHVLSEKIKSLDSFTSKSLVANPKISDTDVFTIQSVDNKSYVNYMKIDEGMIKLSETVEVIRKLDEDESEILPLVIFNLRKKFHSTSGNILTNIQFGTWEEINVSVPKIGDKKKLVELSLKNVAFHRKENNSPQPSIQNKILDQLQSDLKLSHSPIHIECFDNSNIQGSNPVASMVCFRNGKPSKREYRKFNIKTVIGPDDFSSMKEIVTRRYTRLVTEKQELPHLIIIDGGKGQLSAACEALKEIELYGSIPIVGIAKRLEEIYLPNDPYPVHIHKKSMSLKLIQRIRDEAHRFAITFHRDKRSKEQTTSELDTIPGIGAKTKNLLLNHYKSIQRIKTASVTELAQIIGLSRAQTIVMALNKKEDQI